jgi:hypothetical protein
LGITLIIFLLIFLICVCYFAFIYRPSREPPTEIKFTDVELKASLLAIHYHAKRLYNMLGKFQIEHKSIAHSIYKECEDRIPELKKDKK